MKIQEATQAIKAIVENNEEMLANGAKANELIVPYLSSVPGLGKSSIVSQAAEELEMECRVVMFAQFDTGELAGFPYLTLENGEQVYKRGRPFFMNFEPGSRGILFLDELPQAMTASQNVAAQLVNDRILGEFKLPDGWSVIAAGNPMSSKAGTNNMPSHLKDRLTSIEIEPDVDSFLSYALAHGLNYNIQGFVRNRPDFLSNFDPNAKASPSPRSWMRVNTIMNMKIPTSIRNKLIAGQVGDSAMADFLGYLKVAESMPEPRKVLSGEHTDVPEDPMVCYALCAALSHFANQSNVKTLVNYLTSMPDKEFAIFTMRDVLLRKPELKKDKFVRDWFMKEAKQVLV